MSLTYSYKVPSVGKSKIYKSHSASYTEEIDAPHGISEPILPPFQKTVDQSSDANFYYGVRIVTGSQLNAGGQSGCVYLYLIGSKGLTEKLEIGSKLDVFNVCKTIQQQTYDDIIVQTSQDLGEIEVVILENEKEWVVAAASWYVEFLTTHNFQTGTAQTLPCYHWIGRNDSVSCVSKTATVKDIQNNPLLMNERKMQLEKRQNMYKWKMFTNGMPSAIDADVLCAPEDEQFQAAKFFDFLSDGGLGAANTAANEGILKAEHSVELKRNSLDQLVFECNTLESLYDYHELTKRLNKPDIHLARDNRWVSDEEFGRQMLNGVNPIVISRCTKLPHNFPVMEEMVKGSLNRGLTLKEEMQAGHVYICDLSKIMDGVPCRERCHAAAPLCLLYVNGSNKLVPIAIQLKRNPAEDNPIFLPSDDWTDWLMAKMFYQSAHAQVHQLSTHYLSCHAAMEAYAVATMRTLPDAHPIHKLLRPSFRYTMQINLAARSKLINDGGIIDQIFSVGGAGKVELFKRSGSAYRVQWTNIKENLKERGVGDPEMLPGYYYREDGLKVWNALEEYVSDIIDLFYSCDEDVKNDPELKDWVTSVHCEAFPAFEDAPAGRGFPSKIETKKELVEYCTLITFTGSAQHAAVNFGQYDMYGFVPNAPVSLRLPPPSEKGKYRFDDLMAALPDCKTAFLAITVVFVLTRFSSDEIYLGGIHPEWYPEEKARDKVKKLQARLSKISDEIQERNRKMDIPYIFLDPKRIPQSIAI